MDPNNLVIYIINLARFHPFSSDQMVRNLSMKIGDVGLGSIKLCAIGQRQSGITTFMSLG